MNINPKKVTSMHPYTLLLFLIFFLFVMCVNGNSDDRKTLRQEGNQPSQTKAEEVTTGKNIDSLRAKKLIADRAKKVIEALKTKDMKKLASMVHPDKGVRFSPYAFVDLENDIVFKAEQLKTIFVDTTKYLWGYYDGSGEEIKLSFPDYFKQFIYDKNFARAPKIGYQRIIGQGNTVNNNFEVYPNAIIVEYHFPGFNPDYHGMDWESLRLVFEQKDGVWYLVGVIHDQWTI